MKEGGPAAAKRRAGEHAAETVSDGEVVGLGTGSTAAHAIRRLGARVESGLDIAGIPTSYQSGALGREAGIPMTTLDDATPDVAIDGADQVAGGDLIKGGGAAHALGTDLSALVAGGLFSLFVILWALFVDPPRDPALGPHQ